METPNDKHTENTHNITYKKIDTSNPKKFSNRDKKDDNKKSNTMIFDPHHHYFLHDYPDDMHKESVHAVESNISREPITWKTSNRRLLHSKLRPDTSKTSNILLPDLNYTLSTENLLKPKYSKNVPPPVFKEVGSYKCKISTMTSKERLLQRKKLRKEQMKLEKLKEKERNENIDAPQQSKLLKQKENTQYDILFGGKHLEDLIKENEDDKLPESKNRKKSVTRRLLERFQKVPSRSESEIGLITVESSLLIENSSPINLVIEDDDDDSEIEEPEEESEESEEESEDESEEESDEESEQESHDETNEIQLEVTEPEEKELLSEDSFKEKPKEGIRREESSIKVIDKKKIPIKVPKIKNRLAIFKECDGKLCTYDKKGQVKVCEKLMLNIGTSISGQGQRSVGVATATNLYSNTKAFPAEFPLSRMCPNYNHVQTQTVPARNLKLQPNYVLQDLRNPIYNRLEIIEHELQVISINSCPNGSKCDQLNRSSKKLEKSAYDSSEKLYEKELQNYDYLTNNVSQTYQNLKATDHKVLLDLNFQNQVTQTRRSRKKEKNMQTNNDFPSKKNALQVANQRDFKIIHKTPMGLPQWVTVNYPTPHQSQMLKPNVDMIYKNTKYVTCPKYGKTTIPHGNPQRISVNNRKHSYNNNLPHNKNYRIFTYFVSVHQKLNNNLQHSLNLKTVDRNLFIKFV